MPKIGMHCHLLAISPNILKDSKHAEHPHIYFTSECSVQQAWALILFFLNNRQQFNNPLYSCNYFPQELNTENCSYSVPYLRERNTAWSWFQQWELHCKISLKKSHQDAYCMVIIRTLEKLPKYSPRHTYGRL